MGVPALFRWLSQKYPKIISPVVEERPEEFVNPDGTKTTVPVDTRKANPNGEEMDNLYLDMNGIVHPCSHPEDRPAPANEEEMMIAVFEYTDRVVNMVRPRKLLMIAVDGVAPRAKMNQQRSRRFRAAQDAAEKDKQTSEFHALLKASGKLEENGDTTDEKPKKTWDSNSITPGTPFMTLLALSLRYWVRYKCTTDPAWERLKVIISDATVPGEGEHKIMNFIRSQRGSPTHDPNTRHVIYGLDADLIMLGIGTHEPHFRVLREDVFANDTKPGHCRKCNQPGHMASECRGMAKPKPEDETVQKPLKPFIWLHVGILREYLAVEMHVQDQPFEFNLERALDDWVFMCFFVGNDFLPHLPSLEIREDGIDTLIAIWRDNLPTMGGYVTEDGHVNLARAQLILEGLAKQEDAIFERRRENELQREARDRQRAERDKRRESHKRMRFNDGAPTGFDETVIRRGARGGIIRGEAAPDINALPTFAPGAAQTVDDPRYAKQNLTHADIVGDRSVVDKANAGNKSAAAAIKERLKQGNKARDNQKAAVDELMAGAAGTNGSHENAEPVLGKRTRDMVEGADVANTDPSTPGRSTPNKENVVGAGNGSSGALGGNSQSSEEQAPTDTIKLWEDGYQSRYYEQKFHVAPDDVEFRQKVARSYVEGLCWVLLYYFQGCPSWTWYYPYHYAPFAADFKDIGEMKVEFHKGKPFRPYEQLMGVMPAASNHTIPPAFHPLMTEDDSPIIEFYPADFEVDMNGKKFAWQGIPLLPFIDEKRLLDAMATKYPFLTEDEIRRNAFGEEALIFSSKHPLYDEMAMDFYSKRAASPKVKINHHVSGGLAGKVSKDESFVPNSELVFPFEGTTQNEYTSLPENGSMTVHYHMPPVSGTHKSMLLEGVKFTQPVLDYHDVQATRNRAGKTGRSHGGVQLSQNGHRSDGRRINYAARDGNTNGGGYGGDRPNGDRSGARPPQAGNPFANLPPHLAQQAAAHGFPLPQPDGRGYPAPRPPPPQSHGRPPPAMGYPPQQYGGHGNGSYGRRYGSGGGYGNGYYGGRGGNDGGRERRY